ncbi:MAG TPA: thiamine pyrophosphate-dependent enzyme, partial [Ktedonobacterales bacterium]
MTTWNDFLGANAGYALDLYERFQQDPASVDAATRDLFARLGPPPSTPEAAAIAPALATPAQIVPATLPATPGLDVQKVVLAARLARGIREYGHLAARVDPLGNPPPGDPMLESATHGLTEADLAALPASIVWPAAGPDDGSFLQAIERLRAMYCGSTGYDFDHVQAFEERAWLHESVESGRFSAALAADEQREVLQRLTEVEGFERFLASTFPGQKRFSIEGLDMLVPMLDLLIREAAGAGVREVLLGMAHRGRLNVLAHILGKPYVAIFTEFHLAPNKELVPSEGSTGINFGWTGDVKYHLGAARTLDAETRTVRVTLSHNPSHLEFVNPVVQGFTRAAQDDRSHPGAPMRDTQRAVAILVHGDAAFPGEGVVAEALNLGRLPGYTVGGAIHIVANNQIGFTTTAQDGRSTLYASDLAKGFEIPIVHVSADDPEACLATARMAAAYRERFGRDFLIDLVGYRRWGHNEGDEPAYTQPRMYAAIGQ